MEQKFRRTVVIVDEVYDTKSCIDDHIEALQKGNPAAIMYLQLL